MKFVSGHIVEWDLSSGALVEHKVHEGDVFRSALDGNRIVTLEARGIVRVFDVRTCLLKLVVFRFPRKQQIRRHFRCDPQMFMLHVSLHSNE